jgi:uncharacterized membrane protein
MVAVIGIAIIVLGFLVRINPLLVVAVSAGAAGLAAGLDPLTTLAAVGKSFNDARFVSAIWIVLPIVGILERYGLQERARAFVGRWKGATTVRILVSYMAFRLSTAAIGLISIAGHAQTVRPLIAPMAEAAAGDAADANARERIRAMAAGTDNIACFFGEDLFLAIGSILLIKGVLGGYGIVLTPFQLSVWAIPSAVAALLIHGIRLILLDRRHRR